MQFLGGENIKKTEEGRKVILPLAELACTKQRGQKGGRRGKVERGEERTPMSGKRRKREQKKN